MKCEQVQRLCDDLAGGRLPEPLAQEAQRHLADCTDCRVQHQRAGKLQRLLALKRYEQPAPGYFDNFIGEFHARLEAEQARIGFWRRVFVAADLEPLLTWRYGLATAACLIAALGLLWVGLGKSPETDTAAGPASPSQPVIAFVGDPNPAPRVTESALIAPGVELPITRVAEVQPTISAGGPALATVAAHHDNPPRYVLDRITPATYETPNVDF